MKKILLPILALALAAAALAGCAAAPNQSQEKPSPSAQASAESNEAAAPIRLAGLTGPTAMGMVKLLEDSTGGTSANRYEFTLAGSADELTPKLVGGELDIAAVPANLASVLYNNTQGEIQLLAVNTLGVLYLCERGDSLKELSDLKGKTVYATGKGSTPEYTLKYLLAQSGLDAEKDVTIQWKSEPTEVVALMAENADAVALLPQPYVTVALGKVEGLRSAIDLGAQWAALGKGQLVTGVAVARAEFVRKNPQAVADFLAEYSASADWVNQNIAQAAELIDKYGIVKAAVAEKALPQCSITFMSGSAMKEAVSAYLQVLFGQNPKAVGGALPGDDFYFEG